MELYSASDLKNQACRILRGRNGNANASGYLPQWQDNLLPGLLPAWCEDDLRQGSGSELDTKFAALHSSSALAVNTFAPFRHQLQSLELLGQTGFDSLCFEKKVPTGLNGTPPNLDVWLEAGDRVIAVESKFLEYLTTKKAVFSESYTLENLPQVTADEPWWKALAESKIDYPINLDSAQLIKHALGLLNYLKANPQKSATLLYLYWEPANAVEYELFFAHRQHIRFLAEEVRGSKLQFEAMSYPELWSQWLQNPAIKDHAVALMERYFFSLR